MAEEERFVGPQVEYEEKWGRMWGREAAVDGV